MSQYIVYSEKFDHALISHPHNAKWFAISMDNLNNLSMRSSLET